jgi:hypothetical protein
MRRQKPRASGSVDASIVADILNNQAHVVDDLINRGTEPLVQISMQQRVAKQRHEYGWNDGQADERKHQLRAKLRAQLVAASFEIELEQVAQQDESADSQQNHIERGDGPQEQHRIAVWRAKVRAEVLRLLQHREHEQDGDDSGQKNDEPFLPLLVATIHGHNVLLEATTRYKGYSGA